MTYWQMDTSSSFEPIPLIAVAAGVDVHTLDLDITQRGSLGCLEQASGSPDSLAGASG